jgi:hypothetical protein
MKLDLLFFHWSREKAPVPLRKNESDGLSIGHESPSRNCSPNAVRKSLISALPEVADRHLAGDDAALLVEQIMGLLFTDLIKAAESQRIACRPRCPMAELAGLSAEETFHPRACRKIRERARAPARHRNGGTILPVIDQLRVDCTDFRLDDVEHGEP